MMNKKMMFRNLAVTGAVVFGLCSVASAQSSDEGYKYSVGVFGDVQFWKLQQKNTTTPNTFAPGGGFGVRSDQDYWNYVGVEEAWTIYNFNNARFKAVPGAGYDVVGLGSRNGQVFIGPLIYLTPRGSKVRPFFTFGPGFEYFWPTRRAKNTGESDLILDAPRLQGRNGPAFIFGGGVKFAVSDRWQLRADAHGMWSENPNFNLSAISAGPGSLVVVGGGSQLGLQASIGLDFKYGKKEVPPPPPPPPPPPTAPQPKELTVSVSAGANNVCPGETVPVTARTNLPADVTGTYQWTINGENTSSAQNLSFGTTGRAAGNYAVAVTVNAPGYNPGSGSTSVSIRAYVPPTGTVTATPNDLTVGDKALLSSSFRNECDGTIHAAVYTASEGSVSGNTYDSSTVQFDASNRGDQSKTVTITATASDDRSSGTATTSVVVHKPANKEATRLPDLVFAHNNARVNNCGKRLLLEQLKTYLDQDPTGKVVFVGHIDNREIKGLDRRRALNAAAIIRAGKGICLNFNAGQILVADKGADQGGVDFQPYFCGTSASPKTTEKAGQAVSASDKRAQYRRVEVWFVPTNGNLPASGANGQDAGSLGVSKLGCPR